MQNKEISSTVNEKKYRSRSRIPEPMILLEFSFPPLPILLSQSTYNVQSRTAWIAVQGAREQNVRN